MTPQEQCDGFFAALEPSELVRMFSFFTEFVERRTEQPAGAKIDLGDGETGAGAVAAIEAGADPGDEHVIWPRAGSVRNSGRGFLW